MTFRDLLYGVARRSGMVPEEDGIDRGIASQMAQAVGSAYRYAWEFRNWAEARQVVPVTLELWDGRMSFPRQTQDVWDVAGVRTPGRNFATVYNIYDRDPLGADRECARRVAFSLMGGRIFPERGKEGETLWADAKGPAPRITSVLWNAASLYRYGDLSVYEDGQLYRCVARPGVALTGTAPGAAEWERVEFLEFLEEATITGALALYQITEGGLDNSAILQQAMLALLEEKMYHAISHEAQHET